MSVEFPFPAFTKCTIPTLSLFILRKTHMHPIPLINNNTIGVPFKKKMYIHKNISTSNLVFFFCFGTVGIYLSN